MESVPSTQLSNVTGDATPEQFHQYMRSLITQHFSGDPSSRIPKASDWDNVILGFSNSFVAPFPLPEPIITWNALKEKITLLDTALDIIFRASQQVDSLFTGQRDGVKKLFVQLLNLCNILDAWLEGDVDGEDGIPLPSILRKKSFQALVAVLRCLGGNVGINQVDEPRWRILRDLLNETVNLIHDILSNSASITLPISILPFAQPRMQEKQVLTFGSNPGDRLSIIKQSQLAALLALMLDILTQTIFPPTLSHWFLAEIEVKLHTTFDLVLHHFLTSACPISLSTRAAVLSTLVSCALTICKHSAYIIPLSHVSYRLLHFRVLQDSNPKCSELDSVVMRAIDLHSLVSPTEADAKEVTRLLCAGPSEELSVLMVAYIRSILPLASEKLRNAINEMLSENDYVKTHHEGLLSGIHQTPVSSNIARRDTTTSLTNGPRVRWRQGVRTASEAIVDAEHYTWMDPDDDVTDRQYATFYLYQTKDYIEGDHYKASQTTRERVLERLSDLFCAMARCVDSPCTGGSSLVDIDAMLDIVDKMLQGPPEVTVAVRQQTYSILTHVIRHPSDGTGPADWNRTGCVVMNGVVDKNRSVRLAAGRALAALLNVCSSKATEIVSQMFEHLYQLLETAKMPNVETLIIAIGSCGEASKNDTLLGQILCLLISQLGRQNPIIRGLACVKFFSIVKKHNKTPYSMIQPYLDQVAPFLLSRMCSQPVLFNEACRAIAIQPNQFIMSNLARALPQLFADCESTVIQAVAKELKTKPSTLFVKHSHKILAHVFLQQGQAKKSLNFILKTLTTDSQGASIDSVSVVKSCLVPLLAELVISLGEDNPEAAKHALREVERYLNPNPTKGRSLPRPDLGTFLRQYMLGILSGISDMLQGVQGKKSAEVRRKIVHSIGVLVTIIGPSVSNVAPQIMAIFQTMISISELSEPTIESWHHFVSVLGPLELGPHIGPTSAAIVAAWPVLSPRARSLATKILADIVLEFGNDLGQQLDEIADLSQIDDLEFIQAHIQERRSGWTPRKKLGRILDQCMNDNMSVSLQALSELKSFMLSEQQQLIGELTSGDIFDPMVNRILQVLFLAASRGGEGAHELRLLAYECIGVLGAVDPDRCEINVIDQTMIVLSNFTDDAESILFALHLIKDLLVGAFRSTSDMVYQTRLAYVIQELLKFCQFTPALIAVGNSGGAAPLKVRNRWNTLPKHVLETISPLLEARFTFHQPNHPEIQLPVYPLHGTYRDWIQSWTLYLINRVAGETAQTIFSVFRSVVCHKDVVIAHHILPHLVLNVLISGHENDAQAIRSELMVVLEDQVNPTSDSSSDKKLLSAQAVFMLLDHLSKWVRIIRQEIDSKKNESKRSRANQIYNQAEEQLLRVDSVLSSIDQHLMARAAFQCKAYARSLMNFESQILTLQERSSDEDLTSYYEKMHEIYAHLDESDGMEGISTLILSPSLEHHIRQHESTGQWTSAQSCWELKLRQSPDNVEYHLGLLRCLRNLGHYDSLRTHVRGILTRNPDWESVLIGYELESAWMVGAWEDVKTMVERPSSQTAHTAVARVLLALRSGNQNATLEALRTARGILGAPIAAAGVTGYRRVYEAVLDLHQMHELEAIQNVVSTFPADSQPGSQTRRRDILSKISQSLAARLDAILPTFRTREPVLSMRRTAFALTPIPRQMLAREVRHSWIASAKIARKAGQWQTAYSAMLQAQQSGFHLSFVESAKLLKARGENQRALRELENSMRLLGFIQDTPDVLDLTIDDEESKTMKAKAQVLRARWMHESERFELTYIFKVFTEAAETLTTWESGHFRLGQFHDECFKGLPPGDKLNRGLKMNLSTVRSYAKAIKVGSKYIYQTVPRILTIWLDLGEDQKAAGSEPFRKLNEVVAKVTKDTPAYKWYTAFPQIVSRVGITNLEVYKHLSQLIIKVIKEYPKQALWLFTSVIKSTKSNRAERGRTVLDQLRNNPGSSRSYLSKLINQSVSMTNELLALCDRAVDDDKKQLSMSKDFPRLAALGKSDLIVPLQESLIANLPPTSALESGHLPFPSDAPTFEGFLDEIDVMRSLAKPRKITIKGSNGQIYMFLGKPKDDLRKDARLMDFNSIINKLLKANSESRRRQLHIRTYGVVTLNEECGFIQWVPNTIPMRPILLKYYDARRTKSWSAEMNETFRKIKDAADKEGAEIFSDKILPMFPPLFHDWFLETFPEPTTWLTSRLTYSRTAAVMSMVGFILGLGDRHCENILLDLNTGDVVHVDFNCLFEKGKTLETPERVPFRLTQNMVDGLGVAGVEGVFRNACEVTLQLLRDNKDSLMNVLDAFIHDPLVEWEDEKRKLEREPTNRRNQVKPSVDLRMLARNALNPIEKKLKGVYTMNKERTEKELSTSSLVQVLIQEATDLANLSKMYPGWAPWH